MAGNKYVSNSAGQLAEVIAAQTSAGVADANKIPALDSTGRLDSSLLPIGVGAETKIIVAFEALAAGDFVNVFNDSGTIKVRKADASGGNAKKAHGFVLAAVASAANATVYYGNLNNQLSSLTLGATYYLSGSTAGGVTSTAPTTAGHIAQELGVADSTTELLVEIQRTITVA
jgi:hypothetical protein